MCSIESVLGNLPLWFLPFDVNIFVWSSPCEYETCDLFVDSKIWQIYIIMCDYVIMLHKTVLPLLLESLFLLAGFE